MKNIVENHAVSSDFFFLLNESEWDILDSY